MTIEEEASEVGERRGLLARPFRPVGLRELVALALPTPEWVVEGLLPRASATLLTAREKAGKGLLALDLCAAVATGEPFLGRTTRPGPTIYAAAEEHLTLLRDRLAARFGDPAGWPDAPLGILVLSGETEDRLRLEDPDELARLVGMVRERRPAVLVLDTLRELHDRPEDRSDEMGPLLRPLRQLAHQFDLALVVNHHQNKGQEFRGSTAIRAAFDQEWSFHRSDGGEERIAGTLTVEGRFGAKQRLRIALGPGLRWEVGGNDEPGRGGRRAEGSGRGPALRDRLPFVLADRPEGATRAELAAALGVTEMSVGRIVAAALAEDPPAIEAIGSGMRGDPRRFRLLIDERGASRRQPNQGSLPGWWGRRPDGD